MQTFFTSEQLADPQIAHADRILRKCVHCGFCTATCPTYVTLGDELDSPRGRIYLIKDTLENGKPADEKFVRHIDRCLSCLACMTTCPSGVNYRHLVDHARVHIEKTWRRPFIERFYRGLLARILPYPHRFRLALAAAFLAKPFASLLRHPEWGRPLAAMLALTPQRRPKSRGFASTGVHKASGQRRARVALLGGCAQKVLDPTINDAAVELLTKFGVEVVLARGAGCCGALVHHMGREGEALAAARRNIDAWHRVTDSTSDEGRLDAILITTSGCGTTIRDYGHMLRFDRNYAAKAARISALAMDISEFLPRLGLPKTVAGNGLRLAYHSACSLQHGMGVVAQPKRLLADAGFTVLDIPEGHLCCGSAGTYNILQSRISAQLKARKVANIERVGPDLIAAGNIGCMTQIGSATKTPIVHTVQLLNWAHGGHRPANLPPQLADPARPQPA